MTKISQYFNKIFHKHNWVKISFRDVYSKNERYSVRTYECKRCGKKKEVDGRFDKISK